ncbi:MAG: hypothetical protein ACRD2N_03190 [Vicinamibacterales bacterium]
MRALAVTALVVLTAAPLVGQSDVTQTELQRLQESITIAGKDIATLRGRDLSAARNLQAELDELQDEVIYLKVKLRKERNISRNEYTDVRDRIEDLRVRARGDSSGGYTAPASTSRPTERTTSPAMSAPSTSTPSASTRPSTSTASGSMVVPVGTELDVRLQTPLNSGTAQIEDRFEATTMVDLKAKDGRVLIPAGSLTRGVVTAVKAAGRVERKGSLSLSFERITVNGTTYPIRGTLTQAVESEGIKGEAGRIGTGAVVGGIIGGIIGGVKGTIAGILIGGGGTMVASEGEQVDLQVGTVLRLRFDSELSLER